METFTDVIGAQEDWANYITNVEMREQPFLDWLAVGDAPVNPLYNYLTDKYRAPRINSHVDGKPWNVFLSGSDNRGRLKALVQWFDTGVSVSVLAEDVSNVASIKSELAREIPKAVKEMAQDMEAAFCDDQDGREDNKTSGYLTRGVGSWVSSSAQALYPVPTAFLTPAGSINATATASLTEDAFRDVLASSWLQTKSKEPVTGFVGYKLKREISDFRFFIPSSASTQASGQVFQFEGKDKSINRSVDHYASDYFPVSLVLTPWNASLTGSAAVQAARGYFLHRNMWEVRWNQKPKVYQLPFQGGSHEVGVNAILMLVCKNPLGEMKFNATS